MVLHSGYTSFEDLYVKSYSRMKRFAQNYVYSEASAEDILQDVYTTIFEKWDIYSDHPNLFGLVFISVKNKCLDVLHNVENQKKMQRELSEEYKLILQANYDALIQFEENSYSSQDIEEKLKQALDTLPARCREIFVKNKFEGKKQKDIALELNISVNTVENQMAIAYQKLKIALKDMGPLLILLIG